MGQGETPILQLCFVDEPHRGLYLAYDNLAAAQALQSCLCKYVKDLVPYKGWLRTSGSNRRGVALMGGLPGQVGGTLMACPTSLGSQGLTDSVDKKPRGAKRTV